MGFGKYSWCYSILNGNNYALLGSEVFQFANATYNGNNEYTLDTLLRGRRGTEWATDSHSIDELFVFLNPAEILFNAGTLNLNRIYKAITFGQSLESGKDVEIVADGTNLKPFSVINITSNIYEENNDLNIKWMRRDRYISGYFCILPLSEEFEKYHLEIYNSNSSLIRDEYIINDTIFNYSSELRLSDGLFGDERDTFKYRISQVSNMVGDGYDIYIEKLSEHIPNQYSDAFTGIDGSSPSYSFYSDYYYGNVSSTITEIQNNQLRLKNTVDSEGYHGIEFNNIIYGDFDISFDFNQVTYASHVKVGLYIGSVYIYTKTAYGELYYRDYDNGSTIELSSKFPNQSGSIRMVRKNNIISYQYKNTLTSEWSIIPTVVNNYSGYGIKPIIKMGKNYKFTSTQEYLIDNLEVLI